MRTRIPLSVVAVGALVAAASLVAVPAAATTGPDVVPVLVAGNPSCQDLGYAYGAKWDDPVSPGGPYALGTGTVSWTHDGTYLTWSSTFGVDAVIVKGGPNANAYVYDPPAESFGDDGLHSPANASGDPAGISHIEFCYDYELVVTKTAQTSFTRTWDWSIVKVGDQSDLVLMPGQQYLVGYEVTVDATATDSDWAVSGTITVLNPDPTLAATVTGVSDVVSPGIAATVDCGVTFPHVLASGGTLVCTYGAGLPDGTARTNTATATTTGPVQGDSGTAAVDFTTATMSEVDECIAVEDDLYGVLGDVCVADLPVTFEYSQHVGPFAECGEYTVTNTAAFVTDDTGATGDSQWTVDVTVPCDLGCTLTQGYWKTHSEHGPAPYDDAWLLLGPDGQDTPFFLSGMTYHEVLWTAPAGNAYYVLAHQYVAAELNVLNGADPTAVSATMTQAQLLLSTKTPAQVAVDKSLKRQFTTLATLLDQYNNGLVGPGHCSE